MDSIEVTVSEHYYWSDLRENICTHVKVCKTCYKTRKKRKCDFINSKEAEAILWDILSVDLKGSNKIRGEFRDDTFILTALTMIDPETIWF